MRDPNLSLLEDAAAKLAHFLDEIIFVGGVTLGLLITDEAAAQIRGTTDVDVVAEIITYTDYIAFSERVKKCGFTEDMGEEGEAPLACRWRHGALKVDILALDEQALGYTNRWYKSSMQTARPLSLPSGRTIKVIDASHFMGTKMEAFRDRGKGDFAGSHDLEDFVAIIEGRPTLLKEIVSSPADLRHYLSEAISALLKEERFIDVLPGFVLNQTRVPILLQRMKAIASLT